MLTVPVVHLRDGDMMDLVTPMIRNGGVNTVFVMVCIYCDYEDKQEERKKKLTGQAESSTTGDHGRPRTRIQKPSASH